MTLFTKRAGLLAVAGLLTFAGQSMGASANNSPDARCTFQSIGRLVTPSESTTAENVGGINVTSETVDANSLVGAVAVCSSTPAANATIVPSVNPANNPPNGSTVGATADLFSSVTIACTLTGPSFPAGTAINGVDTSPAGGAPALADAAVQPYGTSTTIDSGATPPSGTPVAAGLKPGDYTLSCTVTGNYAQTTVVNGVQTTGGTGSIINDQTAHFTVQ